MSMQNIPNELKSLPQWVCSTPNGKMPMRATMYSGASTVNPDTWSSFQTAIMSVECGNYSNVGFVFNDNGIVGIDIDAGYDEDGFLTDIASDIIGKCKSYTEKSRSGRGFHILVKGDLPFKGKNNLNGVEIYKQARYFIMTGDILIYDNIIANQEAIDYIVTKYFPDVKKETSNGDKCADRIYTPKWELFTTNRIKLRPEYPRIPDGCRNISLTSLAGMLHNQGYTAKQIYDELVYCNKVACEPMLLCGEIQNIVKSVTKYKR